MFDIISFEERQFYLTATEMGTIVKYYKNYDFFTDKEINLIHSIKKWKKEEYTQYNELLSEYNKKIFEIGKDFETEIHAYLHDLYFNAEIEDFSIAKMSFLNNNLKISATPDFLITKNELKILIETKAGNSNTKRIDQYKYQLATQALVLELNLENLIAFIIFKTDLNAVKNVADFKPFCLQSDEIVKLQHEIIECSKKFWLDNKNNNFEFISFQKSIENLKQIYEKNVFVEEDEKYKNLIFQLFEFKAFEERIKNLKNELYLKYKDFNNVNMSLDNFLFKISIIKEQQTPIDLKYLNNELKKCEKNRNDILKQIENFDNKNIEIKIKKGYIKL